MPNLATVSGVFVDATSTPVQNGKIVATLKGSDNFDGDTKIVTQRIEATTDASGAWSMDLIVNGEGDLAATTWTVAGYTQFVDKVFESANLFIAADLDITLAELERTSTQNAKAAKDASQPRLLIVDSLAEYTALPANQRRASDIVLVRGA